MRVLAPCKHDTMSCQCLSLRVPFAQLRVQPIPSPPLPRRHKMADGDDAPCDSKPEDQRDGEAGDAGRLVRHVADDGVVARPGCVETARPLHVVGVRAGRDASGQVAEHACFGAEVAGDRGGTAAALVAHPLRRRVGMPETEEVPGLVGHGRHKVMTSKTRRDGAPVD